MSHFRLARISLILAALGLNAAPALLTSAHAQAKPAAPAADAKKEESVRQELFKFLDPKGIAELMAAKKFNEVAEKLAAADAFPNKTPFETYVIDRMKLVLGTGTGNDKMAIAALDAVLATTYLSPSERVDFTQALGNIYYNSKNFPKAIEVYKQYQKISDTPNKVRSTLILAYFQLEDFANTKAELEPVVAEAEKAGRAPEQQDLRVLQTCAIKLKDNDALVAVTEKLVRYYPTDDFWVDLLHRMENKKTFNTRWLLDALRLQEMATGAMGQDEYTELVELQLFAAQMIEAKQTVDKGYAVGALGTGSNAAKHKQLRDKATKSAAEDAKTIGAGEAAAQKSKDGTGLVNLGYAYVTMGQNEKGLAMMEQGMAKGSVKHPDEAKMHLGIAYLKAGRKADAVKVFESLKGDDGLSDLSKYWLLYINSAKD